MNDTSTIRPASTISLATSPTRRMFSTRSASVKPRSRFRPWRTLSPSSNSVCRPAAMQLLLDQVGDRRFARAGQAGEPEDAGFWLFCCARALAGRRRAPASGYWWRGAARSRSCPAPTVCVGHAVDQDEAAECRGSRRRASKATAGRARYCRTPISFSASVLAASVLQRVDVDLVLQRRDRWPAPCACRSSTDRSGRAAAARSSIQTAGRRTDRRPRPARRRRKDIAAADIDLVGRA